MCSLSGVTSRAVPPSPTVTIPFRIINGYSTRPDTKNDENDYIQNNIEKEFTETDTDYYSEDPISNNLEYDENKFPVNDQWGEALPDNW